MEEYVKQKEEINLQSRERELIFCTFCDKILTSFKLIKKKFGTTIVELSAIIHKNELKMFV